MPCTFVEKFQSFRFSRRGKFLIFPQNIPSTWLRGATMETVEVKDLIITCEACGNVKKFRVKDEEDSARIFREFVCENNCGKNLYSFITVGTLKRSPESS
ncbi:hypothetical protein D6817_04415 [Candidatus Pacearchaeota archaeon]|nr:MAG: hypothetical protein D6817_04415 [Candidatus Pacearchaeota archaeon]